MKNVIEKAMMFAMLAHSGQIRKSEPNKPKIIHPLAVAQILHEYGADNNVIAAACLHDVPEDTKYTLEDIRKRFGEDIAHLVDCDTEPDKSKTWEERKLRSVNSCENLTLREKLVLIADKINNIEDIGRIPKKDGKLDFSAFKRGEREQEWYYRSMYESLSHNENKNDILLVRLENGINKVFGRTMEEYESSGDKKIMQERIEKSTKGEDKFIDL